MAPEWVSAIVSLVAAFVAAGAAVVAYSQAISAKRQATSSERAAAAADASAAAADRQAKAAENQINLMAQAQQDDRIEMAIRTKRRIEQCQSRLTDLQLAGLRGGGSNPVAYASRELMVAAGIVEDTPPFFSQNITALIRDYVDGVAAIEGKLAAGKAEATDLTMQKLTADRLIAAFDVFISQGN